MKLFNKVMISAFILSFGFAYAMQVISRPTSKSDNQNQSNENRTSSAIALCATRGFAVSASDYFIRTWQFDLSQHLYELYKSVTERSDDNPQGNYLALLPKEVFAEVCYCLLGGIHNGLRCTNVLAHEEEDRVTAVTLTDAKVLVAGLRSGLIKIWTMAENNPLSYECIIMFMIHPHTIKRLVVDSSGHLYSASWDPSGTNGEVRIWVMGVENHPRTYCDVKAYIIGADGMKEKDTQHISPPTKASCLCTATTDDQKTKVWYIIDQKSQKRTALAVYEQKRFSDKFCIDSTGLLFSVAKDNKIYIYKLADGKLTLMSSTAIYSQEQTVCLCAHNGLVFEGAADKIRIRKTEDQPSFWIICTLTVPHCLITSLFVDEDGLLYAGLDDGKVTVFCMKDNTNPKTYEPLEKLDNAPALIINKNNPNQSGCLIL